MPWTACVIDARAGRVMAGWWTSRALACWPLLGRRCCLPMCLPAPLLRLNEHMRMHHVITKSCRRMQGRAVRYGPSMAGVRSQRSRRQRVEQAAARNEECHRATYGAPRRGRRSKACRRRTRACLLVANKCQILALLRGGANDRRSPEDRELLRQCLRQCGNRAIPGTVETCGYLSGTWLGCNARSEVGCCGWKQGDNCS